MTWVNDHWGDIFTLARSHVWLAGVPLLLGLLIALLLGVNPGDLGGGGGTDSVGTDPYGDSGVATTEDLGARCQTGADADRGIIGLMPRFPQFGALLGLVRPGERAAAVRRWRCSTAGCDRWDGWRSRCSRCRRACPAAPAGRWPTWR